MAPMKAAEIVNHPAYESLEWNLPPTTTGTCRVALGRRGGPFNLYYEIHGTGPIKLVWIMGLNASHKDWKRQTKYFGHLHSSEYSCLIFDNRGVGRSDKPVTFYSTSEMAKDVVDLVNHVGWTTPSSSMRSMHLIGASMGGMIAQEVAMIIPEQLASLTLCCTAPRLVRTLPFMENIRERANMFIPRHIDEELDRLAYTLFGGDFLSQPDTENEEDPRLNFPTKRDRFAAGQLRKRADTEAFTKKGFMMQLVACYFHHKSARELKELADRVGRERIAVLHGTEDRMLTFKHGEILREELGEGVVWKAWERSGHMLGWEKEEEMNSMIEELVQRWAVGDVQS